MVFNVIFLVVQFYHMFGSAIKYIIYHTFHEKWFFFWKWFPKEILYVLCFIY